MLPLFALFKIISERISASRPSFPMHFLYFTSIINCKLKLPPEQTVVATIMRHNTTEVEDNENSNQCRPSLGSVSDFKEKVKVTLTNRYSISHHQVQKVDDVLELLMALIIHTAEKTI